MVPLARRASLALTLALFALVLASPARAESVLTQNFDAGLGGWATTGFWHVQTNPQNVLVKAPEINPGMVTIPGATLPAAFSGNGAAWFGEASTGTFCGSGWSVVQEPKSGCRSTTSYSGYLTSPSFSLSGAISAILRFRSWWEIEGVNADDYDVMQVEYSTDNGASWTAVGKLNPADNPASKHDQSYSNNGLLVEPGWKNYLVDLSAAIGSPSVRIRFAFDTEDALYNGFRGWLVDDVNISTPFDAGQPVVTDVKTCNGLQPASIWVAHGANFVQGSKIYLDGVEDTDASMPAPDRLELQPVNAGAHTLKLISPNGTASNTLQFASGNCAQQGPGPSGADKRPSQTQVFCNYIVASETDTCTATVADATGGGRIPTGTVKFASASGGAFMFGDTCTLKKTDLSTVSSCTIEGFKPVKGKPLAVSGAYSGDGGLEPSVGATQFLMAAPGNGAYLQTIQPFTGFGAPNGPHTPTVTITVDNPVDGTDIDGDASVSGNGSVCAAGMTGATSSAAGIVAAAAAKVKGQAKGKNGKGKKGKAKGKKKPPSVPGLKRKPAKVKRINAVVVSKVKRNAKKGAVKLKLKFDKRKLTKKFGKRKRLKLVVRVTMDFKKGQPNVIYRELTLKKVGKTFKVVGGGKPGKKAKGKGKAKPSSVAAGGRVLARAAQAGALHRWVGSNDCNQLGVAAQFDQGDNQAPFVGFSWQGSMVCLDGSTVPFNLTPPGGMRGTITGANSVTFSFAEFTNPGFTLSGTLFSGSAAASGKIGGQFPDGRSCQSIAPSVLTQVQ